MFKFKVEYLTCFGAMTINVSEYKCEAWTKWGAWRKFLKDTAGEYHYSDISVRNNFWRMREDIKFCGVF